MRTDYYLHKDYAKGPVLPATCVFSCYCVNPPSEVNFVSLFCTECVQHVSLLIMGLARVNVLVHNG